MIDTRDKGICYVGKIVSFDPIDGADFILKATVVCGEGGKWRGIVKKQDFIIGDVCIVYLPDAILPQIDKFKFMESSGWRVRMRKFKGAPSEVLIMPYDMEVLYEIGANLTCILDVKKYFKPIPPNLTGLMLGNFPQFIPKTDEPNWQRVPEMVDMLVDRYYYITEKCDGSSTTAYRYKGHFGICSRNLEIKETECNGYWKVARKYNLRERLPDGIALQWETCGPGIQKNPMCLKEIDGFAFSMYDIERQEYMQLTHLFGFCKEVDMPVASVIAVGIFSKEGLETFGEGVYFGTEKQREGVVVRSFENFNGKPISFKVINLNYKEAS